ncbi:conjugal transfer protein TraF [candidate division KSB1 bacterium]|nr:conjugal transfer protein TraF [candidate division KSB1 bacterium]
MKKLLLLALGVFGCVSAFGQDHEFPRLQVRNLRSLGMGGAAVAVPAEDNILFYNPALLRSLRYNRINLLDVTLRINNSVIDQYNFYRHHQDEIDAIESLSNEQLTNLYATALAEAQKLGLITVNGPVSAHVLTPRAGAGVFTEGTVSYEIFEGAAGLPVVDARVRGDVQVMAALAHTISAGRRGPAGDWHLGMTGKYLRRYLARKTKTLSGFSGNEDLHFYRAGNFGIDAGAFYVLNRRWQFGAAVYDLLSTTFDWNIARATADNPVPPDKINPSMRLGTAFRPGVRLGKWLYNIVFAFDIDQPFDQNLTFLKKIHFGSAANITPTLSVRGGFSQGYPTFSLGLWFYLIRLDYAFYGEEMGVYAGETVNWNHAVRFQLGF